MTLSLLCLLWQPTKRPWWLIFGSAFLDLLMIGNGGRSRVFSKPFKEIEYSLCGFCEMQRMDTIR